MSTKRRRVSEIMVKAASSLRNLTVLIAVSTVAATTVILPVDHAAGSTNPEEEPESSWSVAPAGPEGPDGRVSLRWELEPGQTADDYIVISNSGETALELSVDSGTGVAGASGAFDVDTEATAGSGTWFEFRDLPAGGISLAAGESRVLPITVAIPSDATPGDHPAGIVVGYSNSDNADVEVINRVGVRAHIHVIGDIIAQLALTEISSAFAASWVPFAPGVLIVNYTIENRGNVRLGVAGDISVGPFGFENQVEGSEPVHEILPGGSMAQQGVMHVVPWFYTAGTIRVTAQSVGEDNLDIALDEISSGFSLFTVSWTGVLVLIILFGTLFWMIRKSRAKRRVVV